MIEWLTTWLREIILVIMLAAFVDLLLPSNAMQRYVKVVISLFILMTILSPLILLIKTDFDFSNLSWSQAEDGFNSSQVPLGSREAMKPLNAVLEEGDQLQKEQLKQSQKLLEDRIAEEMKQHLIREDVFDHVKDIKVTTHFDDQDGLGLQAVHVVLFNSNDELEANARAPANRSHPSGAIRIEPIEDIRISVESIERGQVKRIDTAKQADKRFQSIKQEITTVISESWDIKPSQIDVTLDMET